MSARKPIEHSFKRRGHEWRVQSDDVGNFDEIAVVVGKRPEPGKHNGMMLHAEMMDYRNGYFDVAGLMIWVHVGPDGVARITDIEDHRAKNNRDVVVHVERQR